MTPWLLIPVKSLTGGKSRLARILEPGSRRDLNEFFLHRMLEAASRFPGRGRTAVVSGCGDVLQLAEDHGVTAIHERSSRGLNPAATLGIAALRARGAGDILLIACDLPLVRPEDLRDLADQGSRQQRIVICPDKHGSGTNAIFLPAQITMRFRFGENSFSKHVFSGVRDGLLPDVWIHDRIAFDIDTVDDLAEWERRCTMAGELPKKFSAAGLPLEIRPLMPIRSGSGVRHEETSS